MSRISGSSVVITGAASGLGALLSKRVAAMGGTPVLWDINAPNLERVANEIGRDTGRTPSTWVCDISDRHAVYDTAKQVLSDVGQVDILVNNAGIVSGRSLLEIPDEQILLTFGVNALSLFWTAKAFLPGMLERDRGHVVTVASAAGLVGTSKLVDYCASKHAAVGFNEALRMELRKLRSQVRTTVICPFYIDTGMFEGVTTRFPMLLPILKPKEVISSMIEAIEKNKQRVLLPPTIVAASVFRFLPTDLFDKVNHYLGVNASMDEFVGHSRGPGHGAEADEQGTESGDAATAS